MIDEPRDDRRRSRGELARFTRDLTADARAGRLEPVRSRAEEISRLIDILLRHGKNNPVLVGPAGVGKTAIVDGFAQRIAAGNVPLVLRDVRVLSLDHVALLAGTTYRGQYEERIRVIVDETTATPDVILFIDELHNLIGQGTAMGAAMDAANMLKPALVRGDFRVIGATTDEEYERWVSGDPALERRFQKVVVRELGVSDTLDILNARKERLERHHNVVIADEAIMAAIELTDKHVLDRRRPDKAIDALDEACAHTQAIATYPARAEALIRERVQRIRETAAAHRQREEGHRSGKSNDGRDLQDGAWDQMRNDGMSALERFGAEIEAMFSGVPVDAPAPVPHTPPPRPDAPPPPPPPRALGEIDAELSRVLMDEGIVVRGHDIARVVGLMLGRQVAWEGAPA
ncbi:MAG TPA: AAA family ATPase [Gemmatimonadaceae bacterium]|nr:AAA family ATPase [Gemmatimonadaceae bacterium]